MIADDHPIVLDGLRALIQSDARFQVVGQAATGQSALELIDRLSPAIAIVDLNMPVLRGIDVIDAATARGIATKVIVLAASATDSEIYSVIRAGAVGLVLKEAAAATLLECLSTVAAGGAWLPDNIVREAMGREQRRLLAWEEILRTLTPRERELADQVAMGRSNKAVARALSLSEGTVKVHLNNIFRKAGVGNRTELARLMPATRRNTHSA